MRENSDMVEVTGKVMVVAIILLLFVVVFFFCLHLYFKWFYQIQTQPPTTRQRRRRRRLDFAGGHQEIVAMPSSRIGLEAGVLKSIPVVAFNPNEFEDGLECAVCLCEVREGENARILPKCKHGFHVECIDMWFQSHATCPLCRNPVSNCEKEEEDDDDCSSSLEVEGGSNLVFWGENELVAHNDCMEDHLGSEPSSSSSSSPDGIGMVVIDINSIH
ncbi:hypothetical protein C2S51_006533 [Perilla frutescens var. frutescens]|nr:hypothetical protein C2S51_006533 [Perilla frutescens var. frutescens]